MLADDRGRYHVLKSRSTELRDGASFVGAWPLGLNDAWVLDRTPQLTDSFGREQVRMMLYGADLLDNGCFLIPARATLELVF